MTNNEGIKPKKWGVSWSVLLDDRLNAIFSLCSQTDSQSSRALMYTWHMPSYIAFHARVPVSSNPAIVGIRSCHTIDVHYNDVIYITQLLAHSYAARLSFASVGYDWRGCRHPYWLCSNTPRRLTVCCSRMATPSIPSSSSLPSTAVTTPAAPSMVRQSSAKQRRDQQQTRMLWVAALIGLGALSWEVYNNHQQVRARMQRDKQQP